MASLIVSGRRNGYESGRERGLYADRRAVGQSPCEETQPQHTGREDDRQAGQHREH